MSADVVVSSLWKTFEGTGGQPVVALRGVSLEIQQGQFFVLVGDSGSGKTTLMRSVAGLEVPESGEIVLRGTTVSSAERDIFVQPQERRIGMVFQSYAIWPHLTVYDNVALPLRHGRHRGPRHEVNARVLEALDIVGLSALADRPAPNLSGGQQQRVALARAIAVSSSLLLMDEPMSNLDARLRNEVRNQFRSVANHYGTTVLYVTHDQEEAMALADQMALMRDGQILQKGSPEELYDRSASREVAEFFGPMNFVEGEAIGSGGVMTAIGPVVLGSKDVPAKNVLVGLRPETMVIDPSPDSEENVFEATVLDRMFMGGIKVYEMSIAGRAFRADSDAVLDVGATVRVQLPVSALRVFPAGNGSADLGGAAAKAGAPK